MHLRAVTIYHSIPNPEHRMSDAPSARSAVLDQARLRLCAGMVPGTRLRLGAVSCLSLRHSLGYSCTVGPTEYIHQSYRAESGHATLRVTVSVHYLYIYICVALTFISYLTRSN